MFTISQIQEAHSKAMTGRGFPDYIQALKALGVLEFTTYVSDNHTDFIGRDNFQLSSLPYEVHLTIAEQSNREQFQSDLKAHQQGHKDYPTFCKDCAKSGVHKWIVSIPHLTCTYYDKAGNEVLQEEIPA